MTKKTLMHNVEYLLGIHYGKCKYKANNITRMWDKHQYDTNISSSDVKFPKKKSQQKQILSYTVQKSLRQSTTKTGALWSEGYFSAMFLFIRFRNLRTKRKWHKWSPLSQLPPRPWLLRLSLWRLHSETKRTNSLLL